MKFVKLLVVLLILAITFVESRRKSFKKKRRGAVVDDCKTFCEESCGYQWNYGVYDNVEGELNKTPKCFCEGKGDGIVKRISFTYEIKVVEKPTFGRMQCKRS